MRITLRLVLSLMTVVAVVAISSAYLQERKEIARQRDELERRSRVLAQSLQETVEPLLEREASHSLQRLVERFGNRERLAGVAVYDSKGTAVAITSSLSAALPTPPSVVTKALESLTDGGQTAVVSGRNMHLFALPLSPREGRGQGALVIIHDAGFIDAQRAYIRKHAFFRVLVQLVLITMVTLLVVRWSIVGPIAEMTEWMKRLRSGEEAGPMPPPSAGIFAPMAKEVTTFAKHLVQARTAAEEEARLRDAAESVWTPERLKEHIRSRLGGRPLFLVSNREPYMHLRKGSRVEAIVPAGGLVTALEPVLRACGGVWIAHGAGEADWEVTDANGRLRVPPDDPSYTLRRVALTKEEENGYYYGLSNEGLWPLCHIAHTRPVFRPEDWSQYRAVNEKFANAVLEEIGDLDEPMVLIQDYHFALLPLLVKAQKPGARVGLFWHIPWPNPEAFGICPWRKEILQGMLGADMIGFHTQFHCNNFLDTVDRMLETRIDWEHFSVVKERHTTFVKPYPISISFPDAFPDVPTPTGPPDRAALLKELGVQARFLGVGVDRMDYTKGILERFRAIEHFLERYADYRGQFTFVQLGAPSRTHIKRYHDFLAEVQSEAERINWKFRARNWKPILYVEKHHSHKEILPFYRAADLCMVTSLHDGMNLVAKEFVASRDDEGGALILSHFAGASRELKDALIVNPYDVEQMADAIRFALEMGPEDRMRRMQRMRQALRENNVYRWAADLVADLSQIRLEAPKEGRPA
ncbi:MAG: trehalose-6-phosphate synthase [Elusimicrobiota bacterium]